VDDGHLESPVLPCEWQLRTIDGSTYLILLSGHHITNRQGQNLRAKLVFVRSRTGNWHAWVTVAGVYTQNASVAVQFDGGNASRVDFAQSHDRSTLFKCGDSAAVQQFASRVAESDLFRFSFTECADRVHCIVFRVQGLHMCLSPLLPNLP